MTWRFAKPITKISRGRRSSRDDGVSPQLEECIDDRSDVADRARHSCHGSECLREEKEGRESSRSGRLPTRLLHLQVAPSACHHPSPVPGFLLCRKDRRYGQGGEEIERLDGPGCRRLRKERQAHSQAPLRTPDSLRHGGGFQGPAVCG